MFYKEKLIALIKESQIPPPEQKHFQARIALGKSNEPRTGHQISKYKKTACSYVTLCIFFFKKRERAKINLEAGDKKPARL